MKRRRPRGPDGRLLPTTGRTVTAKGYVRLKRGQYRDWYEHRAVMDAATREWSYYGPGIPEGFHVHHIDYDRAHNCRGNLMLLDAAIHDRLKMPEEDARDESGRYLSRRERLTQADYDEMPAWVTGDGQAA